MRGRKTLGDKCLGGYIMNCSKVERILNLRDYHSYIMCIDIFNNGNINIIIKRL